MICPSSPTLTSRARAPATNAGGRRQGGELDRQHASLRRPEPRGSSATLAVRPEQLELLSVLKASQAISSEIELDNLVRALLETVLVQSGAQQAVLVFTREGALFVEALAALDPERCFDAHSTRGAERRLGAGSGVAAALCRTDPRARDRR